MSYLQRRLSRVAAGFEVLHLNAVDADEVVVEVPLLGWC